MPELTKEQLYIILGVIFVVLTGCVIGVYNQNLPKKQSSPACRQAGPESSPSPIIADNTPKNSSGSILVHINGAVDKEGLFKLSKGDRIFDLLRLSGVSANADLDNINLAEPLADGQKIIIPGKVVASNINVPSQTVSRSAKNGKKININSASEKELDSLPGIGATLAKRIVDHRQEKGRFSNIEALKEVEGITQKKFDKLKENICSY